MYRKNIFWVVLLGLSLFATYANDCCDMEDEMEYCYETDDLEGFNAILQDWMKNC